jgi:hypothetical protein
MIKGVAQVIGMKPIFRSFFSIAPLSCAIASSAPKGNIEATAAIAWVAHRAQEATALAIARKRALSAATCSACRERASASASAASWAPALSWRPQAQARLRSPS